MSFNFAIAREFVRTALAALAGLVVLSTQATDAPSFDRSRVTSHVNKTICASPELSALDRQMAAHYRTLLAQSRIRGQVFPGKATRLPC